MDDSPNPSLKTPFPLDGPLSKDLGSKNNPRRLVCLSHRVTFCSGGRVGRVGVMVRTNRQNLLEVVSYLISFGAFFLFVAIAIRVVRRPSFKRENWLVRLMHQCVANRDSLMEDTPGGSAADKEAKKSFSAMALDLLTCVLGIQVSYLLWGLMQERIMTTVYESGERFTSSKFLVFVNRALAMCVAFVAYTIMERRGQRMSHTSPLYLFSFSSVSNIMSSVSQYEVRERYIGRERYTHTPPYPTLPQP